MSEKELISVRGVSKSFPLGRGKVHHAVTGADLSIFEGETLALVGESGCGKSTLAKLILCILQPDEGEIFFDGKKISGLSEKSLRPYRKQIQMVFQDPSSALDPKMKIREILAEPLRTWNLCRNKKETDEKILDLLELVELPESCLGRYPRQLSGGQKQRIGIARAIALNPRLLVCDESVSALDVSVQAQILNLLKRLRRELSLTCLFISHDLSVVNFIADRVCVMHDGKICELAPTQELYADPKNEYTRYLLSSIPRLPDPQTNA